MYYRIRAAQSGNRLDRTKEGWPTLIGTRLAGIATLGSTVVWLWNPLWFAWAAYPMPDWVRWIGVGSFAFGITWLIWMFHLPRPQSHRHGSDSPERAVRESRPVPLREKPDVLGDSCDWPKPRPRSWDLVIAACRHRDVRNPRETHARRGDVPDRALRRSVPHLHDQRRALLPSPNISENPTLALARYNEFRLSSAPGSTSAEPKGSFARHALPLNCELSISSFRALSKCECGIHT